MHTRALVRFHEDRWRRTCQDSWPANPCNPVSKGDEPTETHPFGNIQQGKRTSSFFVKDTPFQAPKAPGLFLYQRQDQPMLGFHATSALETGTELGILFPSAIIKFQRRKYPRYVTTPRSVATFTRKASQYLNHGAIENISIEGAKLVGKFSQHIRKGDKISPLSMTLRLRFGDFEENITAPEATVRRVNEPTQEARELGIQFAFKGNGSGNPRALPHHLLHRRLPAKRKLMGLIDGIFATGQEDESVAPHH